eukprot:GHVO01069515.1.p1 GENE.GHVO01069515.1~~GHVO01069515.1.p1  ORF type:complete len:118 (-),score=0.46 GHVO01069515.1:243-596(-)
MSSSNLGWAIFQASAPGAIRLGRLRTDLRSSGGTVGHGACRCCRSFIIPLSYSPEHWKTIVVFGGLRITNHDRLFRTTKQFVASSAPATTGTRWFCPSCGGSDERGLFVLGSHRFGC